MENERVISRTIKAFVSSENISSYQVLKVCKYRNMSDENEFKNFATHCRELVLISKNVKVIVPSSDHSTEPVAYTPSDPVASMDVMQRKSKLKMVGLRLKAMQSKTNTIKRLNQKIKRKNITIIKLKKIVACDDLQQKLAATKDKLTAMHRNTIG